MRTMGTGWRRLTKTASLLLVGLGFAGGASPARAFDTGHHSDVTRSALSDEFFGGKAIQVAQLQNWLVDYYTNEPFTLKTYPHLHNLDKLHFDNLYSTAQIRNYWGHLSRNTRTAIQDAARENNRLKALTIIGASLHAVQDFYTHSNWVETHPRAPGGSYRTETWFSNPPGPNVDLYTGYYPTNPKPGGGREPHGSYGTGMNHDAYTSANWEEAYVFAYVASRQWVAAMRLWANEIDTTFWPKVQSYLTVNIGSQHSDLARDLNASYRIAEWVTFNNSNGHWKGSGSGNGPEHVLFNGAWMIGDSDFVEEFKNKNNYAKLHAGLITNDELKAGKKVPAPAGAQPSFPPAEFKKRAVVVRTTKVEELPVSFFEAKIDVGGSPDFFANITVGDQKFVETTLMDKPSPSPKWTTIYFVTSSKPIPITYEMWDEDSGTTGADDPIDINPAKGRATLSFMYDPITQVCSGDISGKHNSTSSLFVSEGAAPDKDRARVHFYVASRSLLTPAAPTPPTPLPTPGPNLPPVGIKPPPGPRPILDKGDKGDWVRYLQDKLNRAGANPQLKIDGDFGAGTKTAVVKFQNSRGLKADGDVGPNTWAALDQAAP